MSTYPQKVIFLACDDIREESGAKASLMGVLGADILIPSLPIEMPPGTTPVLPSFAIFVSFVDGEGKFDVQLKLIDPDGKDIIRDDASKSTEKRPDGAMNFHLKFAPFPLKFGTYKFSVTLDKKETYDWTFRFRK